MLLPTRFSILKKCAIPKQTASRSYGGAADLKILKIRQKSVQQIGKICGVLKVVAQSRLTPAQEKVGRVLPFFHTMNGVFEPITKALIEAENEDTEITTIVIYTDRGLCGGCNNGINRMLEKEAMDSQTVVVFGEKGVSGFEKGRHKSKVIISGHPNIKSPLSFLEVTQFVRKVMEKESDLYRIIYNKMSGLNSSDIAEIWLPAYNSLSKVAAQNMLLTYEVEATASDELLHNLNEYHLSSAINYAVASNNAVELFCRRNSMQSANQNAEEVFQKIRLKYNKARQSMITTELGEIVSGAAAVDEMIKKK